MKRIKSNNWKMMKKCKF